MLRRAPDRRLRTAHACDHPRLLEIWEGAVRATHDFLDEADVAYYRDFVPTALGLLNVRVLEHHGDIAGFVGWRDRRIEMLFVAPEYHRQGVGRGLLEDLFAMQPIGATWSVEVNEDNPAARSFYQRCGFEQTHRSALDHSGRPFPLLYLRREDPAPDANGSQPL